MRICFIASQIAAWGKIGGFGTATRALGSALARNGVEVSAVVPRRSKHGQGKLEMLDGITVHGPGYLESLISGRIFREVDADIYHSQEPTIGTWLAQNAVPGAIHVVTCRDPRDFREHMVELRHTNWRRRLLAPATFYYESGPLVRQAVRRAAAVISPAPTVLDERIRALYGADLKPQFLPYPVDIPAEPPKKAARPTALFVGRFDRRKRIELFFDLARKNPEVDFIAVGEAHDPEYDRHLRRTYGDIPNLAMPGFVPRFGTPNITDYYEKAWILVNTSAREGLPYTFIEAAAYGVSILSSLDPERFASRFGEHVTDGDFSAGLSSLLTAERWRACGEAAAAFVARHWDLDASLQGHMQLYEKLLAARRAKPDAGLSRPGL
jgi:glycosyltransferase involved in cell wall biosynthesis